MANRFKNILSFILVAGLAYFSFYDLMPRNTSDFNAKPGVFSTERAFEHVQQIAKQPHPVGTRQHSLARNYIVSELQEMGLSVQTQQGYALNDQGVLSAPQNIIAKIPGTLPEKKSLLLMSHYDSAVHFSFGASDAASGVATVLEGIRAFLEKGTLHENDIIILFTDAEEIGLLGAELFVKEHRWAKNVGLVLNFEARGSGGPSNMILETNQGNGKLIKAFMEANPDFPVATSLMYSVYKILPNDTDSTVFREELDIPSFFFAFIDDHYDYHTALDTAENLDMKSLAHQGSYLMPLLGYFSNADLNDLSTDKEWVYFNFPWIDMLRFPFSWVFPLLILACAIFVGLLVLGIAKKKLAVKNIFKGFVPFLESLVASGLIAFFGWKLLLVVYPQYNEIQQGFTYNGHLYIAAFVLLSLALSFFFYHKPKPEKTAELFVAPLFLWLLANTAVAFFLKGAAYFIVPVFFALVAFGLLIWNKKTNLFLLLLLCVPAIFLFAPLIQFFPVGLGLEMLVISGVFTVLLFGLLLPVFGAYRQKQDFSLLFLLGAIGFFVAAHLKSDFSRERPKPNSLVYVLDSKTNQASWNTYDSILDDWTKGVLGENPQKIEDSDFVFDSKYNSGYTYTAKAETVLLPESNVLVEKETLLDGNIQYNLKIAPQRELDRMTLFADKNIGFLEFSVNGLTADSVLVNGEKRHVFKDRFENRLLTYYVVNRDTLRIDFKLKVGQKLELVLFEASNDLLENEKFSVPKRIPGTIPRPFVLNDAVVVKQKIKLE
jgi:hypothetical protein